MPASERIDDIQILRGVAALLVVVHHFAMITRPYGDVHSLLHYHFLVDLGACGVDIFFCISGFVMMSAVTTLRRAGRFSAPDFLARRVMRIVPLYWILTTIFAALVVACGFLQGSFANALPVPLTANYLLTSYTLLPSYMPGTRTISPFLFQGWTLSYEFYFYFLICCSAAFFKKPLQVALSVVAAIGGLWVAARALPQSGWAIQAFMANSIVFEFATVFFPAMQARRVLLWGLPSALIVLGAATGTHRTRAQRIPLLLGNASFSIYLTHLIPLYLYAGLLRSGYFAGTVAQYLAILGGTIVAILMGLGLYQWLEKPLLVGLHRGYGLTLGRRTA